MKTEYVYVQGKASWARLVKPEQWADGSQWKITLHPTTESLEVIRDLQAQGLKNVIKKDDDGYFVTFRRPVSKARKNGGVIAYTQPEVIDKDGVPMDGSVIGNGSDVVVKLEVYSHKTPTGGNAKAARLHTVKVFDLVKYTPEKDDLPEQSKELEDIRKQEQLF